MVNIVSFKKDKIPVVCITRECQTKIDAYVQLASTEIAWVGLVKEKKIRGKVTHITLVDAYAPPQEVTGTTADIDADWGGYPLRVDDPTLIRWWGHSHVNMGVSPSGSDITTFMEHIELLKPKTLFVMSIHNKAGLVRCNLYLGNGTYAEDVPIMPDFDTSKINKVAAKEIKSNLREHTYVKPLTTNRNSTSATPSYNPGAYSGSWGDRKSSKSTISKDWNKRCNIMGFR